MHETYVISLGGSVVVPQQVDIQFVKELRQLLLKNIRKGKKFIIICGGGKICRDYQKAASEIEPNISQEEIDWIGVQSTRFNAQLFHAVMSDVAHKEVIHDPSKKVIFKEGLLIAAGWKPGWSTDYVATMLAKQHNVNVVINVTGLPYVYDKDPNKDSRAKPFEKISWENFRKMFGSKWSPGLNSPFDPIASKLAHEAKIKVIVTGPKISNIESIIGGKKFIGTEIL